MSIQSLYCCQNMSINIFFFFLINPESRPMKKWTLTALLKWECKGRLLKQPEQTGSGVSRTCTCVCTGSHSQKPEKSCSVLQQFPAHCSLACTLSKRSVILPPTRFLATAHVTIISKPLNLSELHSLPGGPGLFSSKLSLYAVHKHSHRKKVKIGWTETRNERETRIGQLEEQFKQ